MLTDQGTNLMGEVMREMWEQLGVHQVHTSVYHPQCNGLVERFNKSLKGLLRKFAIENPGQWPQLIDPVLFAVREVPQASTCFSPLELLFGCKPRGILDLMCRQWGGVGVTGSQKKEVDMEALKAKLRRLGEWARANLQRAQDAQKWRYDEKDMPREFAPGDQVLLLIPSSDVKLMARWQGPFKERRRVGTVDYEIEMPRRREETKVYHVNLLKKWRGHRRGAAGKTWDQVGPR